MIGNDNHCVPYLNAVLTVRNDDLSVAQDSRHKHALLELHFHKRNTCNTRVLLYDELRSFHLAFYQVVESLNVASHGVFHSSDVAYYCLRSNIFRIDYRVQIKVLDNVAEIYTVYFGNKLGVANASGKQRQQDIFLVQIG